MNPKTTRADLPPPKVRAGNQRRAWPADVDVRPVICNHCGGVVLVPPDPRAR